MADHNDEPTTEVGATAHPWRAWALSAIGRPEETTADGVSDEELQDEIADALAHGELAADEARALTEARDRALAILTGADDPPPSTWLPPEAPRGAQ